MKAVDAREFLKYSPEFLLKELKGEFRLVFDDGSSIVTDSKAVSYSSFVWEFHRRYPKLSLKPNHFLHSVLGNDRLGKSTHLKLINNVLWDCYDVYCYDVPNRVQLLDELARLSYQITNNIFNILTVHAEEYQCSINILDFAEIALHPEVVNAVSMFDGTDQGVNVVYGNILKYAKNKDYFQTNSLAHALRAGLVNQNQFLQCIGMRGFVTDIDSYQFREPIAYGFFHGIRKILHSFQESRSAAKNLFFSKDPLRQSEYFSRRQQLICQYLKNLHAGDCGSNKYLIWQVRDATFNSKGFKTTECDLVTLAGKYYLCPETNRLRVIKRTDKHLIGKTLQIRSPIAGCAHPDPYGICETCFGEAFLAVPENTNIGHMAVTYLTERLSQSILSVKHLDGSAVITGVHIDPADRRWLATNGTNNKYFISPELAKHNVQLMFKAQQAPGLSDVNVVDSVHKLNVSRVSTFDHIGLVAFGKNGVESVSLPVYVENRMSSFTHEMLDYIKINGWKVTENDVYVIDLGGWDITKPILSVPMVHFNMSDHQEEIANILEATMRDIEHRDNNVSPTQLIVEFHDLVNRRLSPPVSLAVLEIVLFAAEIVSASNDDYGLPKSFTDSGMGVMKLTITERSLAPGMAYERQRDMIASSGSVIRTNRLSHPMDGVLMPEELFGVQRLLAS